MSARSTPPCRNSFFLNQILFFLTPNRSNLVGGADAVGLLRQPDLVLLRIKSRPLFFFPRKRSSSPSSSSTTRSSPPACSKTRPRWSRASTSCSKPSETNCARGSASLLALRKRPRAGWPTAALLGDRMGSRGLRPVTLPHHRTCGFPHPAVETGAGHWRAGVSVHGIIPIA